MEPRKCYKVLCGFTAFIYTIICSILKNAQNETYAICKTNRVETQLEKVTKAKCNET
jgi:hypothetical protein